MVCTFWIWKFKYSISFWIERPNIEWHQWVVMTNIYILDGRMFIYSTCLVPELVYFIFVWYTIYRERVRAWKNQNKVALSWQWLKVYSDFVSTFVNDLFCFFYCFVTSHACYFSLTFGIGVVVASALSIFGFWYCSDLISFSAMFGCQTSYL